MLAVGVVDHDHREAQLARLCHGAQTVNARRGLFAAAYDLRDEVGILRVHEMDKVAAVVDDDVRRDLQHAGEVFVIFPHRAAVGGVDLHPAGGERRGDVVLRGEGFDPVTYISAPPISSTRQRYAVFASRCTDSAIFSPAKGFVS